MPKYYIEDKEFGKVFVTPRQQARSFVARWKEEVLYLTIPQGSSLNDIRQALDSMRERIKVRKVPKMQYHPGQIITGFRHSISISTQSVRRGVVGYGGDGENLYINMPIETDFSSDMATRTISGCLEKLMATRAQATLLPFAQSIAQELGVHPTGFDIGRGKRKLGHCTSKGIVQLSHNLMFYPEELVRLVICHEYAHLTHMNHSPEFHHLCNRYLNGAEPRLERLLKTFRLPILK